MARGEQAPAARPASARNRARAQRPHRAQAGAALLVTLALLGLIVVGYLLTTASGAQTEAEKERRTADALAQAKEALIGYALARGLGPARPGDLPCPDVDNDGSTEELIACGDNDVAGTYLPGDTSRLGRLPWRTLGLPDLRDGDGERLWYAVSRNFKNNRRSSCVDPTEVTCLNSDTPGTITVYDRDGRRIHDATGAAASGVIAVIIAPGAVLKRAGSASAQNRDAASLNNPQSYLDVMPAGTLTAFAALAEDNAGFADTTADGFIQGPVRDAAGSVIVNDRIIVITTRDLMPRLERRVAAEVVGCLERFAGLTTVAPNFGRYPSASPLAASSGPGPFPDGPGPTRMGRIPDTFNETSTSFAMASGWDPTCPLTQPWWMNWKSHVFYAVASPYAAGAVTPPSCGSCLIVDPPLPAVADKKLVVIVAGRALAGQLRISAGDRSTLSNYLEGENDWAVTPADTFAVLASTPTRNDLLVFR